MNDLKFAFRQLLKNPGFTAVAVLTLALGIGANTAMFSFVNAILLRPLPYPDPDRLVMVFENHLTNGWFKVPSGAPVFEQWQKQNTVFEGLGAIRSYGNFTLTGNGPSEALKGASVSANLFPLLGIQPLIGRGFLQNEEIPGNHRVVLLSYGLWQRRFGGQSNIVGQSLMLGGVPHTVVGVLPAPVIGPYIGRDLWTPLAFAPHEISRRDLHDFPVYGRLKPGVTLAQARAEMNLIARRMAEGDPQSRGWGAELHLVHEIIVGNSPRLLLMLLGAVALVLLIGCANIAGLLLARLAARAPEFAIRVALGAGRGALIRQLLMESCVLALIGGTLGIVLARLGLNALVRFSPPDLPRMAEGIPLDETTLAFTALITLMTGVVFGLIPAWWQCSKASWARELSEMTRGSSAGPRHQFARVALVIGEVAISLVLLTGAGLTVRSFSRLLSQNLGFVPEHLLTMRINLPGAKYPGLAERMQLFSPLLSAVQAIPGIDSASFASGVPLSGNNTSMPVVIRDAPPPAPGEAVEAGYAQVSPDYFATMRIPLLQGRDFSERDHTNMVPVVIVDETFVKKFKLGTNVLGRRIDIIPDSATNAEIVGLVKEIKRTGMTESVRGEMYRPYRQVCWGGLTLVVRTRREPADITRAIRAELDNLDKDVPLENVRTMSQLVAANVAQRRLSVQLLSGFAGGAVLLSALGLYGVLAYVVSQRTRELGIRIALGAQQRDVFGLVIGQGMRWTALGVALGLAGALALTRVLQHLLYEIEATDPLTFAVVAAIISLVAFLACWLPARRAMKIDPMEALREQ